MGERSQFAQPAGPPGMTQVCNGDDYLPDPTTHNTGTEDYLITLWLND